MALSPLRETVLAVKLAKKLLKKIISPSGRERICNFKFPKVNALGNGDQRSGGRRKPA